ncbi:MAG: Holliday junction resolvase RuvX [Actinomycetaceae bacterium]|nr:Holliday junction resolvase RuvX [Actinomycetaceae bacterium]
MRPGVRLGVDYGGARIGVSVSDPQASVVLPLTVVQADPYGDEDVAEVAEIAREREAVEIIVGYPRHMSGKVGSSARAARKFAVKLGQLCPHLRVALVDERLTSVQAQAHLSQMQVSTRERKGKVDPIAAAIILETALEMERSTARPAGETVWRPR